MAWDSAVTTSAGTELLSRVLAGETLVLDHAAGGIGMQDAEALILQTELKEQKKEFSIASVKTVESGKKIGILVDNRGITEEFTMTQLGIWAKIGTEAPVMLAILQDSTGVKIPTEADIADFAMNFYAIIAFSGEGEIQIHMDPNALISLEMLKEHTENQKNPHKVTCDQVGALPLTGGELTGNVNNSSGGYSTTKTFDGKVHKSSYGTNNISGGTYVNHSTDGTEDNYLFLTGEETTFKIPLAISGGGTNAKTATEARENLGLGKVPNVATNDQTPTYNVATTLTKLTSGEKLSSAFGKIAKAIIELISHIENEENPHSVTSAQVGLGNVPNVATNDQTPTYTAAATLTKLTSGEKLSVSFGKIAKAITELISHIGNKSNPHEVTAEQAGAAPGGFGLGKICYGNNGTDITDTATLDGITVNSFWCYRNANTPLVAVDPYTKYVHGLAIAYSGLNVAQIGFCLDSGTMIVRDQYNGTLSEWRFENPPMVAGVEYPTTEKRNGATVYRKRISYTNVAAFGTAGSVTDITIPHGIEDFGVLVRCTSKAATYPMPHVGTNGHITNVLTVDASNITVRTSNAWAANVTWDFDIAYTKTS